MAPPVAAPVAFPSGSICRTLASICAQDPMPRLADRCTVAPTFMGRVVFSVKVGAGKAGSAAAEFFTTETDSATGDEATGAAGSSTNVVVPPGTVTAAGDLRRNPVNGVTFAHVGAASTSPNPIAAVIRIVTSWVLRREPVARGTYAASKPRVKRNREGTGS